MLCSGGGRLWKLPVLVDAELRAHKDLGRPLWNAGAHSFHEALRVVKATSYVAGFVSFAIPLLDNHAIGRIIHSTHLMTC